MWDTQPPKLITPCGATPSVATPTPPVVAVSVVAITNIDPLSGLGMTLDGIAVNSASILVLVTNTANAGGTGVYKPATGAWVFQSQPQLVYITYNSASVYGGLWVLNNSGVYEAVAGNLK